MMIKLRAQVLVTTILVLLIISLTVLAITSTVRTNTSQVSNNLEYARAYNLAEGRLIQLSRVLSTPEVTTTELSNLIPNNIDCDSTIQAETLICTVEEGERKTVLRIFDTPFVENFELSANQYFDVMLSDNFSGSFNVEWVGDTALSMTLVYEESGELKQIEEVVDPTGVYSNQINSSAGFLANVDQNDSQVVLNFNPGNTINLPSPSDTNLEKVRIRLINNNIGSSITIRPDPNSSDFPDQVRRVETLNYSMANPNNPVPVIISQFPLSPMLPDPVTSTNSFAQIKSPVCGNSVIEGAEECDDGNDNEADDCNNECKNPIIPFIAWVDGYDDTGFNTNESITQIAEGIASNLRGLDRDVTFFGSGNCPELNSKVVIFFSSKNTYCTLSVTDYVVNNPGIRLTVIGDSAGADGLRSIAYPFGIRCDDFETGVWKEVTIESILFPNGRIGSSSACEMTGGARVDQSLQGEIESSRCVAVFRDAVGSRGEENGWCAVWVVDLANGSQINFYTTWDMQNSASFNNPDNRGRELGERAVTPLDEVN